MKTRFKSIFIDSDSDQCELWKKPDIHSVKGLGSKVLYDFAMFKVKEEDIFDQKMMYITWNKIYYSNSKNSDLLLGMIELDWLGVEFSDPSIDPDDT